MPTRNRSGALTDSEKPIVKKLLENSWRNQDIQALVNMGRPTTINSARVTEVKNDETVDSASDAELEFYQLKKKNYDPKTGLNFYDDERLVRAREAMILAVQVFNSPGTRFKTEVFTILTNVAWTYLAHEFYVRKGIEIVGNDGRSMLLSKAIERHDCPFSKGARSNLRALKVLRDDVEHKLLGPIDVRWYGLFQANCVNFDKSIRELFGDALGLSEELSVAIQFAKLNFDQTKLLNNFDLPEDIAAIDARLTEGMDEHEIADLEFQFRVVYTLDAVTKSRAHFQFIQPDTAEGKEIRNVLVQHKLADHLYPHKPGDVIKLVTEKAEVEFSMSDHTRAWKKFETRPATSSAQPENTKKDYCIFHTVYGSYTYSDQWIALLVECAKDKDKLKEIRDFK